VTDAWTAFVDTLHAEEWAEVCGEGEGWIASRRISDSSRLISVRSDDGSAAKHFAIQTESVVADMLASAKWVASLSERERERALAAVECLEGGDG
jgi:hypothetical protein